MGEQTPQEFWMQRLLPQLERIIRAVRRRYPGAASRADTEDDLHELLARVYHKLPTENEATFDDNRFCCQCYRVATNFLVDRIRRETRQHCERLATHLVDKDRRLATHPSILTRLATTEEERYYWSVLRAELADEEWRLWGLIQLEGCQQTDAFRRLGIPESTGRDRLTRIRAKIARIMQDKDL